MDEEERILLEEFRAELSNPNSELVQSMQEELTPEAFEQFVHELWRL